MVLGPAPLKESQVQKDYNYSEFWAEPRLCMVLGPKPMGKPKYLGIQKKKEKKKEKRKRKRGTEGFRIS